MKADRIHHWAGHSAALYAMAEGRDPKSIFSAGADRMVAEWSLGTAEPNNFAIRVDSTVYSLAHIPNHQLIIACANGSMHVIDTQKKEEVRHLKFHEKGIFHLTYHAEKERLYAACADGSVSVWNTKDWSLMWHLPMTHQKVRRIALSPNGALVAFALGDGSCALLNTSDHKVIQHFEAHDESCNAVAFIDQHTLITGGKDAYLKTWDILADCANIHAIPAHNFAIYDIIVHPDHQWIATGSRDKTIKLWNIDLQSKPLRLDRASAGGHINSVNGLFYHAVSETLFSCSDDRSICAWRIQVQ